VLRKVIERLSGSDASRWFSPTTDAVDLAAGLHAKAEGLRNRLAELATAYADGLVTIGQMTSATETLRASLIAVEAQMGKGLRSSVLAGLDVEYVYQEWNGLDIHTQREIILSVIESVVILPAGKGARVPQASNVVITFRN